MSTRAERAVARSAKDGRAQAVAGAVGSGAAGLGGKVDIDRRPGGDGGPSRGYRLKPGEGTRKGVRRIAAGRADHAVEQLDAAGNGGLAAGIHEARKDLKKLRSLLRLVREGLGEKTYRRENERYRDAGRQLSGARDAEVKIQTLSSLQAGFGDELPESDIAGLRSALEQERPEGADEEHLDPLKRAAAQIAAGRKRIRRWPLKSGGWDLLEPGLRRSYRRGREQMNRTRDEPTGAHVHEWRKRVKDLWYHLRIVQDACPDVLGETADRAHELGDLLGDHHDLAVLAEDARARAEAFDEGTQRAELLSAILRRQGELLADAFEIGERLYSEKPREFSRRIETYWTDWRESAVRN